MVLTVVIGLLLPVVPGFGQQIAGVVTAEDTRELLISATVYVPAQGIGTVTGSDGSYSLTLKRAGVVLIVFSYTGYQRQEVEVTINEGEQIHLSVALEAGIELDPIQVTAGRRAERVLEAPSSMDVLFDSDIREVPGPSAVASLWNVTGIDASQTGVDRYEVALRGFNEAFSGATYVMSDYRHAAVPSFGVNIHGLLPSLDIDLDRIEVVRGPGSALYGAGVSSGVVHYITKSPFDDQGIKVALRGGQQSLRDIRGRAAASVSDNLGVKIAASFTSAEDFALEDCDPDLIAAAAFSECPDPHDAQQISLEGLRETDYRKRIVYGTAMYRLGRNKSATFSAGESRYTGVLLAPIGTIQAKRYGYRYAQVRLDLGGFFFQAYTNRNDAGDTFLYSSSKRSAIVERSTVYSMQAHYDGAFGQGRYRISAGSDVDLTRPETMGGILGRFDKIANLNEIGLYAQVTARLSRRWEFVAANRGDFNNAVGKFQLSPRTALVYQPSERNALRFSFNRSFFTPNANTAFIDLEATRVPGTDIIVRARGSVDGFTWRRDPNYLTTGASTDLVASSLLPFQLGAPSPVGLDTGQFYSALYEGLQDIPIHDVVTQLANLGLPVTEAVATTLLQLLSPENLGLSGFSRGRLALYNVATRQVESYPEDLVDISPLRQTVSHTYEVGYKGLWGSRAFMSIDAYYARRKHFTGPLRLETPLVLVPTLAEDLARDLADGIEGNAQLAGGAADTWAGRKRDRLVACRLCVRLGCDSGSGRPHRNRAARRQQPGSWRAAGAHDDVSVLWSNLLLWP